MNDYIKKDKSPATSKAKFIPLPMASEKNKAEIRNIDEKNTEENENNNLKVVQMSTIQMEDL